jgi:hypothetical protein
VYRLGKHSAGQAPDVQIFHGDEAIVINQPSGQLVLEIVALVEYLSVQVSNPPARPAPTSTPLGAAGQVALLAAQFPLCLPEPPRIIYDFGIAGDGKGFQSYIDADTIAAFRQWFRIYEAGKTCVPFAIFLF